MKLNVTSISNPRWANRSKTLIDCEVTFEELGSEVLPFTANPNDSEEHGREIYNQIVNGDHGDIAEFSAVQVPVDVVKAMIVTERNQKLPDTDWTQNVDVPQSTKDAWAPYRQELRDMTDKAGYPWYETLVSEADFGYQVDVSKAPWPIAP